MSEMQTLPYHSIPRNKLQTKQLTNWAGMDGWVLLLTALIIIAGFIYLPVIFALMLLSVIMFNARLVYGRMYREIYMGLRGVFVGTVLSNTLWAADDHSNALVRWLRGRRYHVFAREKRQAIPLRLEVVEAQVDNVVQRFGLLQQTDRPLSHLYIVADGSDFSSLDQKLQHAAVDELASVTNMVAVEADLKCGVSYLRLTGPEDFTRMNNYLAGNMNPVVFDPSKFELDDGTRQWAQWMRKNANELKPTAQTFGSAKPWYVIVVTIKRSRGEWRRASKGKLSDKQLHELPIVELGKSMVEALRNAQLLGLSNVRCLGLAELASLVRCSWDVADIDHYYSLRAAGKIPTTDDQIETVSEADVLAGDSEHTKADLNAVITDLKAWPSQSIQVGNDSDFIQIDNNFISMLRITKQPGVVRVDQFHSLHHLPQLGRWTRMAMVGETVSGESETRQLMVSQSAQMNLHNAFFSKRLVQNPKYRRRQAELSNQTEQVSSNSVGQHYNFIYPVVAASYDEMVKARKQLRAKLSAHGFSSEVIKGKARQMDAFITGALGANRL